MTYFPGELIKVCRNKTSEIGTSQYEYCPCLPSNLIDPSKRITSDDVINVPFGTHALILMVPEERKHSLATLCFFSLNNVASVAWIWTSNIEHIVRNHE